MTSGKAPTTSGSLDEGHINSIEAAVSGLGITVEELLSQGGSHRIRHNRHYQHDRATIGRKGGSHYHKGL